MLPYNRVSSLFQIFKTFSTEVVTLEHATAAPFCTGQLTDLSACVIMIAQASTGDVARS